MMTSLILSQHLSDKIQQIAQSRQMTPEELLESLLADARITPPVPSAEPFPHTDVAEYFNQIAGYLPVVFFISTPNRSHIHYISPAYEKIVGQPLEEGYKGIRPFLEIVHPDDRLLVETTFKQQAQGHETSMEYRVIHPDGAVHWIRSTAFPIQDANGEVVRLVGIAQDITEQKQTLDDLHMNEVKLKTLFEVLPVGVSLLNRDLQIVEMNPMLEQIVGFSLAELQEDKHRGRRYIASDGSPVTQANFPSTRTIAEQRPVFDVEIGFVKDDEEIIWTSVSAAPLPLADYSAVVVTRDITRRKQAERALQDSEMRLANILDFSINAIIAVDIERRILLYNQGAERIFGYTADEMRGQLLDRLIPPRFLDGHANHMQVFAQSPDTAKRMNERGEIYGLRRDGTEFAAEASISRFMQNGEPIFTVMLQDITGQRQLESEARIYQAAVEASNELLIVLDRDYQYVIVNETYLRYHQMRREDVIGKSHMHIMGEEYFTAVIKPHLDKCLMGEAQHYETTYTYPQLGKRHLLVSHSPLMNASGEVIGVVKTLRDITEQKQAEQQAFNLLLEHERVNILTNFIQDASHEFRTPLAIMQSSLYLMSKKDDADYRAAKLEQIDAQIARMTRLIDMLITLSRLDSGLDFAPEPTNISYIVREIVMERQSDFAHKQHTLQLDLAEVPPVKIDAKHFAEAMEQLLDNALHFTPENGMIMVSTSHTPDSIIVEINDTGEGIDDKDLPHVLERFYRADTAHTKSGFGLGLAIAYKVITEHHGTIIVNNRAGGGCIVKIVLPM